MNSYKTYVIDTKEFVVYSM